MKRNEFKSMWENMQKDGYFSNHPHYSDYHGKDPTQEELELDDLLMALNYACSEITMPAPYSASLERSIKRTESVWLYRMFDLPSSGIALDVGCGFGRSVKWMSHLYDHVIGTDISERVIALARQNCKAMENTVFYTNDSNSLPSAVVPLSIDVAYIFTVFQHIPREFALGILRNINRVLKTNGRVVFNLLSNINEDVNTGMENTEWAIGYSEEQAIDLLERADLHLDKIVRWTRPETEICWLWVSAHSK